MDSGEVTSLPLWHVFCLNQLDLILKSRPILENRKIDWKYTFVSVWFEYFFLSVSFCHLQSQWMDANSFAQMDRRDVQSEMWMTISDSTMRMSLGEGCQIKTSFRTEGRPLLKAGKQWGRHQCLICWATFFISNEKYNLASSRHRGSEKTVFWKDPNPQMLVISGAFLKDCWVGCLEHTGAL